MYREFILITVDMSAFLKYRSDNVRTFKFHCFLQPNDGETTFENLSAHKVCCSQLHIRNWKEPKNCIRILRRSSINSKLVENQGKIKNLRLPRKAAPHWRLKRFDNLHPADDFPAPENEDVLNGEYLSLQNRIDARTAWIPLTTQRFV